MQNYGKFDATPFGKIEQNWANVAFADGLHQIFSTGKSVFSSSVRLARLGMATEINTLGTRLIIIN